MRTDGWGSPMLCNLPGGRWAEPLPAATATAPSMRRTSKHVRMCAAAGHTARPCVCVCVCGLQEVRSLSETEVQKLEHAAMLRELRAKATALTATQGGYGAAPAPCRAIVPLLLSVMAGPLRAVPSQWPATMRSARPGRAKAAGVLPACTEKTVW